MGKNWSWNIAECGWDRYFAEVAAISKGRTDLRIVCGAPGIIALVEV